MLEQVLDLALGNGLWAVLFVLLLFYQIRSNNIREQKYQAIIERLANSLGVLKNIDVNITGIVRDLDKCKRMFVVKKGARV